MLIKQFTVKNKIHKKFNKIIKKQISYKRNVKISKKILKCFNFYNAAN